MELVVEAGVLDVAVFRVLRFPGGIVCQRQICAREMLP